MTRADHRVDVLSTLNYTKDTGVQPEIYYHESDAAARARMPGDDPREMTIHDGWHRAPSFALDKEGFAFRAFHSTFVRGNSAAFRYPGRERSADP